jgi:hypothetical protein
LTRGSVTAIDNGGKLGCKRCKQANRKAKL